jgi:preprotein translocase subunit SecY
MQKALEPLILSWRVPELRRRILYVLGMVAIYVFALHISVPQVDQAAMQRLLTSSNGVLSFLDIFSGGALGRVSILALGIMPYITAQIVFQVLTIAFPYFKELQKEGEYGRRKMAQYTRWSAVGLTLVQSLIADRAFVQFGVIPSAWSNQIVTILAMTAGTMYLLWLGEQVPDKGIGNGISFIIFVGIVAALPKYVSALVAEGGHTLSMIAFLALFVVTVVVIVYVTQGERRIQVKYAPRQAGRRMVQAQRSYLPLKMAAAGVIPIIFASSIVLFPGQIATFYVQSLGSHVNGLGYKVGTAIQHLFAPDHWFASLLYALLVLGFTYFYTAVIFDVRDLSDNLKRYGGQVPGYAPGRPTQLFIDRVLTRITFAGGIFLAFIALLQWWAPTILGLQGTGAQGISRLVGGTSLLIVVAVTLDIMQNLDQQLKMRQYEGFARQMGKGKL